MKNTEYLLEPRHEVTNNMIENFKVHDLLVEYFEASLEACQCCDTMLEGIHQMKVANGRVTRVIKLTNNREIITSFALQNNPLSSIIITSPVKFRDIHERYMVLLHKLRSKRDKIRRKITLKRVCKKVGGIGILISLIVAVLAFAFHSIVGFVVAPCLVGGLFGFMRKRFKNASEKFGTISFSERLCEQLDVAAKGVYILINDLDTMSRMVKRLYDEVEHLREVADICVKNIGKGEIVKEVVREFQDYEANFMDQLEELEDHIYLCFLTINRSRRLVMQEITGKQKI